jgi:hypothetical protein
MTTTGALPGPVAEPVFSVPPPTAAQPAAFPADWTVADLQQRLGGIPLERIHLYSWPGRATEEDLHEVRRRTGRLCELIDGTLVEKVMGFYESILAIAVARSIKNYLELHRLGVVGGEAGMLRILGRQIRIPDVSFITWDRLPPGREPPPSR